MERQLQTFRRRFIISVLQFLVAMGFDLLSELEKVSMKYLELAENQSSSSNLEHMLPTTQTSSEKGPECSGGGEKTKLPSKSKCSDEEAIKTEKSPEAKVKTEKSPDVKVKPKYSDSSEWENNDILEICQQAGNNAQSYNFHQNPGNPYQISNFLNNFYINAPLNEAAQPQGAQYQLPPQLQQIQQIPQIQQSQQGQQLLQQVAHQVPQTLQAELLRLPYRPASAHIPNQLSQHVQYKQAKMLQLAPGDNHHTNPYQQQPYAAPYIPYSNAPTMVDNTPAATTASTSNPLIARYVQTCLAF